LRYILGHDDLRLRIDGDLAIVGLNEPVLPLHDAAFGVGEVLLVFRIGLGRGRRSGLAGLLAAFGLALRFGFCPGFGFCFRRSLGLRLELSLRGADLFRSLLLVGNPVG